MRKKKWGAKSLQEEKEQPSLFPSSNKGTGTVPQLPAATNLLPPCEDGTFLCTFTDISCHVTNQTPNSEMNVFWQPIPLCCSKFGTQLRLFRHFCYPRKLVFRVFLQIAANPTLQLAPLPAWSLHGANKEQKYQQKNICCSWDSHS